MTALAPSDPRHGTQNGYGNLACRCRACTDAHAAAIQHRVVNGTPGAHGSICSVCETRPVYIVYSAERRTCYRRRKRREGKKW